MSLPKPYYESEGITVHLADCMEIIRCLPDGHFDLAIVDPPFGINAGKKRQYHAAALTVYSPKPWDSAIPDAAYFKQLFRVSKHQIIWGANYFTQHLPPVKNWIVWDKLQPDGVTFSMHELAFYSGDGQAKIYRGYNGANRVANNDSKAQKYIRIHPTQKPARLYEWLFANYSKPGQLVLDTHFGSGSIGIAAREFGVHLTACEIDPDYCRASVERIIHQRRQGVLITT